MTVNDSLHSLLDCECLLFCVTDLVLIYGSVTSSTATALNDDCLTNAPLQSRAEQSRSLLPAMSRHGHSWHRAPVGPVAIYLLLV
jgi:hypothetical protein